VIGAWFLQKDHNPTEWKENNLEVPNKLWDVKSSQ